MGEFDYIIVGTGFAGSLFLKKRLEKERRQAKFLVLERGARMTHAEQIAARRSSSIPVSSTFKRTGDLGKNWNFSLGFGGGSNCWWAGTPRFHPNDFRLKSVYGVGRDWPLQYDDLVPYYEQAERIMNIAGTPGGAFGDGVRYPQRPHRHTDPEKALKNAYPDQFFNQPTARARESGAGRNVCCANSVCHLCPIDAKFTVQN
ncbi:MAG: GMC family oxidoreductase, partial [Pseudomonadota bacterium]